MHRTTRRSPPGNPRADKYASRGQGFLRSDRALAQFARTRSRFAQCQLSTLVYILSTTHCRLARGEQDFDQILLEHSLLNLIKTERLSPPHQSPPYEF